MGTAEWLFFAVPGWYFLTPFAFIGPWWLSPAFGVACLAVGTVWGVSLRRLGLAGFLVLPASSQALLVVAGLMRGSMPDGTSLPMVLQTFLMLQLAGAVFLILRLKGARLPAIALAVFTMSYAHYAAFIAGMALTDLWL